MHINVIFLIVHELGGQAGILENPLKSFIPG